MPEAIQLLLREHEMIKDILSETRTSLFAAVQNHQDSALVEGVLEQVRDLVAFLSFDLEAHIAKEEDVLFPPLRELHNELELVVEDMVVQHDAVKDRRDTLERVLDALDHDHDDVRAARQAVADCANATGPQPSRDELENIRVAVVNVDTCSANTSAMKTATSSLRLRKSSPPAHSHPCSMQ